MEEKKYHVDNKPVSAREIIEMARDYDEEFDNSSFYQTSIAANILRKHNHIVGCIAEIKVKS